MFLPAVSVQHLPQPKQPNHIPWEDQIKMKPKDRSLAATISWILLLLLAGSLDIFIPSQLHLVGFYGENPVLLSDTPWFEIYTGITTSTLNCLWIIESYRIGAFLTPLMRYVTSTIPVVFPHCF
jgi:hypothetical protein